jgi:hypothetical protein
VQPIFSASWFNCRDISMKRFLSVIKFIAIGFFSLILVLAIFPLGRSSSLKKAQADSSNAYPGVCLGGWENPGNAAGTPDVPPGGTGFTNNNSAVLNGEQAQIFCGSFQASDQSQTPASVTLHFSWNVVFASQAPLPVSTDTDSSDWTGVLDATSTATSTPDVPANQTTTASSTPPPTPTSTAAPAQAWIPTPTSTPASTPAPTSTPSSTPAPAPVAPPASGTSDASQSSTSFLEGIMHDPFAFLIQRTFAQTASTTVDTSTTDTTDTSTVTDDASAGTADGFIDVSYSLDGTTWIDLGQVSASDWQNYSVTIPVSSWGDINKLQIQLSPDITADEPVISLDGMWLEVNDNQSFLGDLQDGAAAAINAVNDLSNTVNNALSNLLPTDNPNPTPNTPAVSAAAPPPPAPPAIPQHQYEFALQGAQSIKVGRLPWDPEIATSSNAMATTTSKNASAPTVSLPGADTIEISGPCTSAYYTILIFANPNDYKDDPSSALYNEANVCTNGSFTQTLSDTDFPPQLSSGTYYLVIANQGTKGPWVPDPEIFPITLSGASSSASSSQ